MSLPAGLALFAATVIAMEAVAYGLHRWVMHSRLGWRLHASHHRERAGWFEANDLYGMLFALPSVALIYAGVHEQLGPWAAWVGAGIAGYGLIYFGFHDVIVHGRIAHRIVPRSRYFRRIVQAHKLHHAVQGREGAVSFGFVYAPPIERLKRALGASAKAEVRAPRGSAAESTDHRVGSA
ncbi:MULTISPECIES: sterol desaturase family protein [Sphingomonas]|uniref:sterol desaturase family protein n=1 Tax=Sphingomonas TaxID=13687 RepID=UPI000DEF41CF|nr:MULTISPECIES: sterol desaturase family protein [Sphingomonas]